MKTNILLESGTNELEVVEFILKYNDKSNVEQTQSFGINVAKIREIIRMPKLTKMPNMPPTVYGVFNLRDQIIPAVDICKFLYNAPNQSVDRKMIIAEFNKIRVGFIVHDVQRIHRISWSDIISPDSMQEFDPEKSSIIGLIAHQNKHILMLDVEKIIADIDPTSAIDGSQPYKVVDKKFHIFTAEDSVIIRKMITDRLIKAGFEVTTFNDGLSCWEDMQEIEKKVNEGQKLTDLVHLLITDIEMPRMDGYSLTKLVKDSKVLGNLPVVIFSSIVSKDVLHKGESVGANAQLTKPQIGELLDVVRLLIDA